MPSAVSDVLRPAAGSVMLVTGGSRGIGAATALLAAQHGWRVALCYQHHADAAAAVVDRIRQHGGSALALPADVSDENDVQHLFATVTEHMGRIDALVNNAGVAPAPARLDEMSLERWQQQFQINVIGSLLCAREAVRQMSSRHGGTGGAIVNVGSAASRNGSPGRYVDYAASKGAIDSFTIGLARELAAEGIRVNAVRPGITDTTIHQDPDRMPQRLAAVPMRRIGTPQEIAEAIVWLCSPAASYVTGTLLDVAGGA